MAHHYLLDLTVSGLVLDTFTYNTPFKPQNFKDRQNAPLSQVGKPRQVEVTNELLLLLLPWLWTLLTDITNHHSPLHKKCPLSLASMLGHPASLGSSSTFPTSSCLFSFPLNPSSYHRQIPDKTSTLLFLNSYLPLTALKLPTKETASQPCWSIPFFWTHSDSIQTSGK